MPSSVTSFYPTAPPRTAGIGIADTVSSGHIDLNTGLVSSLYNPYAAVPSMHFGYALVAGAAVAWLTSRRPGRLTKARLFLERPAPIAISTPSASPLPTRFSRDPCSLSPWSSF